MGLYLIYCEILLVLLSGLGESFPSLCFIFFSFSAGLIFDALLLALKKSGKPVAIILCIITALYFDLECILKKTFGVFFSISNMIVSTRNVVSQYGNETLLGTLLGLGYLILYLLPPILFLIFLRMKKNGRLSLKLSLRPVSFIKSHELISAVAIAAFSIVLYSLASLAVSSGPDGQLYGTHFNFRDGVETFGLTEATRLSFVRVEAEPEEEGFKVETSSEAYTAAPVKVPETSAAIMETTAEASIKETPETVAYVPKATESNAATASDAESRILEEESLKKETEAETRPLEAVPEYNVMDIVLPTENVPSGVSALSEYISTLSPSLKNDKTGLFAGKNLIMICAESYDDAFIRPELTPTLYRLTHNGFYFSNYYQPSWGGSTSTGELSMLLGLDGIEGDEAFQNIADNDHYFSMGRRLKDEGYVGACFHNGSHTFYRRDLTHVNLGYDEFYACGQHLEDFTGHSYPSDSEMMEGTLPHYLDIYLNENKPFNLYYMTVTGHAPYVKNSLPVQEFWDQVDSVIGDEYATKTKYYICFQMELEKMLTVLISQLEEAGIADDTVIVLTADHYPYGLGNNPVFGNDKNYNNDLKKEKTGICFNADKTGLIIWSGCLEHENKDLACEVGDPVVSLDILPTVLNLFGIEFDSRLLPGRDVFGGTAPLVYWNNLSWITDKGRYLTKGHTFTPAEGTSFTPEEEAAYIDLINTQVGNRIKMSTSIMKYDYYHLIFAEN